MFFSFRVLWLNRGEPCQPFLHRLFIVLKLFRPVLPAQGLCVSSSRRCKLSNVATKLCTVVSLSALAIAPLTGEGGSHFAMLDGNKIHYNSFVAGDEEDVFIHDE